MKICHIGNLPLDQMGDITREIFNKCAGEHVYYQVEKEDIHDYYHFNIRYNNENTPKADIYLLHCFKNNHDYFFNFRHPHPKSKIISLIHSSFPCQPSRNSDYVVTITKAASEHFRKTTNIRSTVIPGAIDLTEFLKVSPDYEFPVIGKISRNVAGKFHSQYFDLIRILAKKYSGQLRIISSSPSGKAIEAPECSEEFIIPDDMNVDRSVRINDHKAKANSLRKLNIYADAHAVGEGVFIETLCTSTLEAMACGLPVVILGTDQPAMVEVVGDGGIVVYNIFEFYKAVEFLSGSEQARREWGARARKRALEFNDLGKMIISYDNLFEAAMDEQ